MVARCAGGPATRHEPRSWTLPGEAAPDCINQGLTVSIGIKQARQELPDLIDRAEAGERLYHSPSKAVRSSFLHRSREIAAVAHKVSTGDRRAGHPPRSCARNEMVLKGKRLRNTFFRRELDGGSVLHGAWRYDDGDTDEKQRVGWRVGGSAPGGVHECTRRRRVLSCDEWYEDCGRAPARCTGGDRRPRSARPLSRYG